MAALFRYVATMSVVLYAYGTAGYLLAGQGLAAFVASAFALLWVGWMSLLFGLPPFLVLVMVLPQVFDRFIGTSRSMVGLAVGFAVWAGYGAVCGWVIAASGTSPPGGLPPTPVWVIAAGLIVGVSVGLVGALLGLIEARASRPGAVGRQHLGIVDPGTVRERQDQRPGP